MKGERRRSGGTLVEIMIAVLILMVLAVAGGSYLAESRGTLAVQRNKASALAAASGRLEALRGTRYSTLTNLVAVGSGVRYLRWNAGAWVVNNSDPGETVTISGMNLPIQTAVQYVDLDGGVASYDALWVRVQAGYRPGRPERVSVDTFIGQ